MKRKICSALAAALTVGVLNTPVSWAVPVDLELVLLTDVSGSVDAADFDLMINGYATAFQGGAVQNAIAAGTIGSIAVTLAYFSDAAVQSIGWTLIDSAAAADAFAASILATPRPFAGGTGLTNGMNFASGLFAGNDFEGTRRVIDVVGDGAESNACAFSALNCVPLQDARDNALNNLDVSAINALWIDDRNFFGDDPEDTINALVYGTTNVIGGTGAFQNIVQDFAGFQTAITAKLEREVSGVPEPATIALFGVALAGLGMARRRRRAQAE